ncbi:hypothetical protein FFA01_05070 [Frigoribacterium faeni]|uniref:Uncharacterized protein n=2 Tax=Frigoribacterium faeni TaxID=145483 RepID=A0ABQ0UL27_9MICO|nr:hypothetical protein FFA01_05070 [Frigoribacterium faeni]
MRGGAVTRGRGGALRHTRRMRIVTDMARGAWFVDRIGGWAEVGGVAGRGFEAYARILHPIDASRSDLERRDEWGYPLHVEDARWPWAEVARRNGKVMHPLVQWRRLTADERRMDWPDGWSTAQSREGWLDPRLLGELVTLLGAATTTPDDLVAGVWIGWGGGEAIYFRAVDDDDATDDIAATAERDALHESGLAMLAERERARREAQESGYEEARTAGPHLEIPGREFVLFETDVQRLADPDWGYRDGLGWAMGHRDPSLQLLWPEDHAWVLASEIDWDSTIVAGDRRLIDAVLADPRFESYGVGEADKLSWDGDTINREASSGE